MIRRFFYIFFLLVQIIISGSVLAQNDKTSQDKLNFGKKLIREEKWEPAKDVFRGLMNEANNGEIPVYAQYYYALAQFNKKEYKEANVTLSQLLAKKPDWRDREEVYFLQGWIAFEQDKHSQAIEYLNRITGNDLKVKATNLIKFFLEKVDTAEKLKKLHEKYPQDAVVANALADKLFYGSTKKPQDKALLDKLVRDFKIDRLNRKERVAQLKDSYNVGLFFPFQYNNLNPTATSRSNQFVLDLYNGIKIAQQDLESQGIKIDLQAYDTEKDNDKIKSLLSQPELRGMDLIIGPVYAAGAPIVADFAKANRINMVNPLSSNLNLVEGNMHAFLAESSIETQAKQAAAFAAKQFPGRKVIIIYENNSRDSLMAAQYRNAITAENKAVTVFRAISKGTAGSLINLLKGIGAAETSHIFISSTEPVVAAGLVSALEMNRVSVPVVARSEWLHNATAVTLEQWQRQNVYFIFPNYIDTDKEEVKDFRAKYTKMTNLVPSVYAYQGYDLMMFYGKMLAKYGPGFEDDIQKHGFEPTLLGGFDYRNATDNQYVPVVRVEEGTLKIINGSY